MLLMFDFMIKYVAGNFDEILNEFLWFVMFSKCRQNRVDGRQNRVKAVK